MSKLRRNMEVRICTLLHYPDMFWIFALHFSICCGCFFFMPHRCLLRSSVSSAVQCLLMSATALHFSSLSIAVHRFPSLSISVCYCYQPLSTAFLRCSPLSTAVHRCRSFPSQSFPVHFLLSLFIAVYCCPSEPAAIHHSPSLSIAVHFPWLLKLSSKSLSVSSVQYHRLSVVSLSPSTSFFVCLISLTFSFFKAFF